MEVDPFIGAGPVIPRQEVRYLAVLWRRRWVVIPFVLLGLVGALTAFSRMTRLYRGEAAVILIPQSISETIYSGRQAERADLKDLLLEINATAFMEAVAEQLHLNQEGPVELRTLRSTFDVQQVDAETFLFHGLHSDPAEAAHRTNVFAHVFVDRSRNQKLDAIRRSAEFLKEEIHRLDGELSVAKRELADYQAAHRGELPTDREAHRTEQAFLRAQVADLDGRIESKKKARQQRLDMLSGQGEEIAGRSLGSGVMVDPRLDRVAALKQQLSEARLRYTDRHPKVIRLRESLEALLQEIRDQPAPPPVLDKEAGVSGKTGTEFMDTGGKNALKQYLSLEAARLETEIQEMMAEKKQVEDRITRLERLIQGSYLRETELDQMGAGIALLEKRLLDNQGRLQELQTERKVFQQGMDERFAVKADARVPLLPYRPDLLQLLIVGVGVGLLMGVGLALLRELLDRSVQTVEDVESLLGKEILASIPDMSRFHWQLAESPAGEPSGKPIHG
ncbi:MAG: GumC family protein [Acidobacteriota bacterium]